MTEDILPAVDIAASTHGRTHDSQAAQIWSLHCHKVLSCSQLGVKRVGFGAGYAQVFACTVGQKPSRAPFYVNEAEDVHAVLRSLADSSLPLSQRSPKATLGHSVNLGGAPLHALALGV